MSIEQCDFCNEFSGGTDNSFSQVYRERLNTRILFRSADFAIVPSMGQIVEGYLLIIPLSHYTSVADMPPDLIHELSDLCDGVRSFLSKIYGGCLFFEHGVRGIDSGGCGIDHAHLHAVPLAHPSEPIDALRKAFSLKAINGIHEIANQGTLNSSYLFYEGLNGRSWITPVEFIPSQYLRKQLAETIGTNLWNWRDCGIEETLIRSVARLSKTLGDYLPVRLYQ